MGCLLVCLLCLLGAAPAYAQSLMVVNRQHPLTQGLRGWWRGLQGFSTGLLAYDLSPYSAVGTLTNMSGFGGTSGWSTTTRLGGFFQLNFDGVDDFVAIGTPSQLADISQKTLAAWIYPTSYGLNAVGRILDKRGATGGWNWYVDNNNVTNGIGFAQDYNGQAGTGRWTMTNVIPLNTWTHVGLSFDAATASAPFIYINGVSQGQASVVLTPSGALTSDASTSLYLGDDTSAARNYQGAIDDVRIYDRLFTQGQMKLLYDLSRQGDPGLLFDQQQRLVLMNQAPSATPDFFPFFQPPRLRK